MNGVARYLTLNFLLDASISDAMVPLHGKDFFGIEVLVRQPLIIHEEDHKGQRDRMKSQQS